MLLSSLHYPNALPVGGTMFRNVLVNPGFNVNQRQTSSNATAVPSTSFSSGPTPSSFFVADRWIVWRTGFAANSTFALVGLSNTDAPFVSSGLTNYARIARTVGDTSTSSLNLAQNLETVASIPMAAKTLTLSFYARAGAGFSGSSGNAVASLGIGALVDQNVVLGLGAGSSTLSTSWTPSTSWTRQTLTVTVPATATQICPTISYAPTGTAVSGDYLDVTGVQLEISTSATPYELRPYPVELALCSRYYLRTSFPPGQVVSGVAQNGYYLVQMALPAPLRNLATAVAGNSGGAACSNFYFLPAGSVSSMGIETTSCFLGSTVTLYFNLTATTPTAYSNGFLMNNAAGTTPWIDITNEL